MRSNKDLHEALILFTAKEFLSKEAKNDYQKLLLSKLTTYLLPRRFSPIEYEKIVALSNDEIIVANTKVELSYLVYALELMKLWAVNATIKDSIGFSKKKLLKGGKDTFTMAMIVLRQEDKEDAELKESIINDSVKCATIFYNRSKEIL